MIIYAHKIEGFRTWSVEYYISQLYKSDRDKLIQSEISYGRAIRQSQNIDVPMTVTITDNVI